MSVDFQKIEDQLQWEINRLERLQGAKDFLTEFRKLRSDYGVMVQESETLTATLEKQRSDLAAAKDMSAERVQVEKQLTRANKDLTDARSELQNTVHDFQKTKSQVEALTAQVATKQKQLSDLTLDLERVKKAVLGLAN